SRNAVEFSIYSQSRHWGERGNSSKGALRPFRVEFRPCAGAVKLERAGIAGGVGALEDPVLPGGQAAENPGLHRFRPDETQVGFEPGQRVGGEARALLEHQADFLVPIDLVISEG